MSDDKLLRRLLSQVTVDAATGCWVWTGSRMPRGYGRIGISGRRVGVHRQAYQLLVGEIPAGLEIDHLCRNRLCCNPSHLEPVTGRENTMRGCSFAAVNAKKTHCVNGHEFTPENTLVSAKQRDCRACNIARKRQARQRARAALIQTREATL